MFRVTARTVLELGSELISSDIIAFYELVKNGFDAGSKAGVSIDFEIVLRRNSYLALRRKVAQLVSGPTVDDVAALDVLRATLLAAADPRAGEAIRNRYASLLQNAGTPAVLLKQLDEAYRTCNRITVADVGHGMSRDDLAKKFLVIGTATRKAEVDAAILRGDAETPYLGEKGIGRLSAMRLGQRLRVETAREVDTEINLLELDWRLFGALDVMLEDIKVESAAGGPKPAASWHGTRIIVGDLAEDWTEDRAKRMAEYDFARLTDPFLDAKSRPRIRISWNGSRIAIPWLKHELLGAAHATFSGHYRVVDGAPVLVCRVDAYDLGFKHPHESEQTELRGDDLTSMTAGLSQAVPDEALVSLGPFSFEGWWYNRRRLSGLESIGDLKAVRDAQAKWSGMMLFRDGFRVFPYGDDEDDWLGLDRKSFARRGYLLNKTQFVGRVCIGRIRNPELVDQTNREGLRDTPEKQIMVGLIQTVIQDRLFGFMRDLERRYDSQPIDLSEAKVQVQDLERRAVTALKRMRQVVPKDDQAALDDLQHAFSEFSDFAQRARARIGEVERESRQMIDMAGVGLMVEVIAHELARASEKALEALEALKGRPVPEDIRVRLDVLRSEMKSVQKRLRVLDPLSVSGRQTSEVFDVEQLVADVLEGHAAQFARHNVSVVFPRTRHGLRVRAVKGLMVQILENLVANSVYWMGIKLTRDRGFRPTVTVDVHGGPPTILYQDNGPGIAPDNREAVFRPFFSLKEKTRRRGLGLFIARECAERNGGTLTLSDEGLEQTGRLRQFVIELPAGAAA